MKIPSTKPHFFKPIVPGFKQGLKVPIGFLKYLKGQDHEYGILRRNGKKWQVKLNGHRFEAGWAEFAEEHDLQLGNILVFRHERDMEFEVSIFDSSYREREYAEHVQEEEKEEELADLSGNESLQPEEQMTTLETNRISTQEKSRPNIMPSHKAFRNVEAANDLPLGCPHFTTTITLHCKSNSQLHVPKRFACENGLSNRKCTIMIKDEERSWEFKLHSYKGGSTSIGGEWRKFCSANFLKGGDRIMFEIFAKGDIPTLKFYDLRETVSLQPRGKKNNCDCGRASNQANVTEEPKPDITSSRKAFPDVEAVADTPLGHPHFVCTMKPYYLSNHFLRIPRPFARVNSLRNRKCTVMIRDEQRPWTFSLYSSSGHTYISGGWRDFCTANCLKNGDYLMFEMVSNGDMPTFKFHDLRGNASAPYEGKKTNLDAESVSTQGVAIETSNMTAPRAQVHTSTSADDNPKFISTIQPYSISKHCLYLPIAFAKSNGLANRRCEMILVDEQRKSWSVQLSPFSGHVGINRGWRQFKEANDVQVGDTYKFELINETIPLAYFHCKYSGKDAPGIREALDRVMKPLVLGKGLGVETSNMTDPRAQVHTSTSAMTDPRAQVHTSTSAMTDPRAQVHTSTSAHCNPQFISTIQPYSISQHCLYLPLAFAKSNGLVNRRCEMILVDKQRRSWLVQLRPFTHHVGIGRGWHRFKEANDVQVGDTYKFELINNETIPVAYLHCKYSGKDAPGIREAIDKVMKQLVGKQIKEEH